MHPCGGLAQRLHIAPCAGSAGSVVNGGALALVKALPHIERYPRVVLAAGAVATLPDAAESVPYRDAPAVFAAGQVPRLHGGNCGPQGRAGRFAPELPQPQGGQGAVRHGVVLVQVCVGVHLVFVGVIDQKACHPSFLLLAAAGVGTLGLQGVPCFAVHDAVYRLQPRLLLDSPHGSGV